MLPIKLWLGAPEEMPASQFRRRRIYESIFNKAVPWSPVKAYLLGQFKAGCNLQKKENGFQISSTNLHHLIKIQIWLRSNHKIYFNLKQKQRYKKGSAIYTFHVRNALMISDLKLLGFVAAQERSAKNNAPMPISMPKSLLPHYLRGFLDERGHPMLDKRGMKRYRLNYPSSSFLREVVDILESATGIRPRGLARTIHKHRIHNSYNVNFNGDNQLRKIFNYLYLDNAIPLSLYNLAVYTKFCDVLGFDSNFQKIDLMLDIKSLYVLHATCCENNIDPNAAIAFNLPKFLKYCQTKNLITNSQKQLIRYGRNVAAKFCGTNNQIHWNQAFQNIAQILGIAPTP